MSVSDRFVNKLEEKAEKTFYHCINIHLIGGFRERAARTVFSQYLKMEIKSLCNNILMDKMIIHLTKWLLLQIMDKNSIEHVLKDFLWRNTFHIIFKFVSWDVISKKRLGFKVYFVDEYFFHNNHMSSGNITSNYWFGLKVCLGS